MEYLQSKSWLEKRETEVNGIIKALSSVKSFTVKNPVGNLNVFHETMSSLRETQEFIRTYLLKVIDLELEAKRFLGLSKQACKDATSAAFITYKDKLEAVKTRSLEEKNLHLRAFVPEIKEQESWEDILESIQLLKEAVDLVYQDLSKASMTLSGQIQVIKNQILTGEIRIALGEGAVRSILSEGTMDSMEKAAFRNDLQNKPDGSFDLGDMLK